MSQDAPLPTTWTIPENFRSIVCDFLNDLSTTFPEYAFLWKKWRNPEMSEADQKELFAFFTQTFPERFFDILYQNESIFDPESEVKTVFLPNVDFKILFHCGNITENTKQAIWKYLQLILVSVLGSVKNKEFFGDAMNLFEGFDETVIQEKLNETIHGIGDFFKNLGGSSSEEGGQSSEGGENAEEDWKRTFTFGTAEQEGSGGGSQMPSAEELHEHLKGLFDGKIGSLAKELAEELTNDMKSIVEEDGTDDIRSTQDILKKMMKNPKKLMDLMKTIGTKLQNKMKSGDISEEEIIREASELMGKMKGMGGGKGGFADIMKNMAQGLAGNKMKFNAGAFQQMEKRMATKERMLHRMEQKRQGKTEGGAKAEKIGYSLQPTPTPDNYVFRLHEEEVQEKTMRHPVDIDVLAKEIEKVGEKTKSEKKAGAKKKKAKK